MTTDNIHLLNEENITKAFQKFEALLSTRKARECLQNAQAELAFDTEVFLQPLRNDLAECIDVIASLTRERGTTGKELEKAIPILSKYLDPGADFSQDVARLEKLIADKKRRHPDFILAVKLQMLVRNFEEKLNLTNPLSADYTRIKENYENVKATLAGHMKTKMRIAQHALAPDMLELAQAQIQLMRHHEKILYLKKEILDAGRTHTEHTLKNFASVFKDVEPELADTILLQTQSLIATGDLPTYPALNDVPKSLDEYKENLAKQGERLKLFDKRLHECMEKLTELMEFEETIFNMYSDQLREKGVQFKKKAKVDKTGTGMGIKYKKSSRMVSRRSE